MLTTDNIKNGEQKKYEYDETLDITGFGKYNICMLASCCLLILAMYMDVFGYSVVLPVVACDMQLSTAQQGLLSAVPLIGVMISSYAWGLCADTLGRRKTLLMAMPVGTTLNFCASMAPTFTSLAALKFLSASFTSSANAAAFVLAGETVPLRHRSRFMFLMASATMFVQIIICVFALPIFEMTFTIHISWLSLIYRPWRLLMQTIAVPGVVGVVGMVFLDESPKFLLSKGRHDDAIDVLRTMYRCNTGKNKILFPVTVVCIEEESAAKVGGTSTIRKMWDQTAPLFKPPLLKNSLKLYYLLLCAYMTATGFAMWVPTVTNAYFDGSGSSGKSFCEIASRAASSDKLPPAHCDHIVIKPLTLYAVMCYSGVSGTLTILLSFLVPPLGKRWTTLLVFGISALTGVMLLFVTIPLVNIALFYVFLYVALIQGNVNTYLVELNPTYLRGMATCLSVVVARGFGFFSVQIIAALLADHCEPMVGGYLALVISGLVVAVFLPPDIKLKEEKCLNGISNVPADSTLDKRY